MPGGMLVSCKSGIISKGVMSVKHSQLLRMQRIPAQAYTFLPV